MILKDQYNNLKITWFFSLLGEISDRQERDKT